MDNFDNIVFEMKKKKTTSIQRNDKFTNFSDTRYPLSTKVDVFIHQTRESENFEVFGQNIHQSLILAPILKKIKMNFQIVDREKHENL